jgi:hypothetical protein
MAGNKQKAAWIISLISQGLWMWWIIVSETYGFIPLNLCIVIVSTRNYLKWKLEEIDNNFDSYIPDEDLK